MPLDKRLSILIVRLGAVGDVVRQLPLLRALRRAHPEAHVGWLVEEASAGLLKEIGDLDAVHVLPRRELARCLTRPWTWPHAISLLATLRRDLRKEAYSTALDVHGTLKAAVCARLAGAPVEGFQAPGSKEGAQFLYKVAHPFPAEAITRIERALLLGRSAVLIDASATAEHAEHGLDFAEERSAPARAFVEGLPRPLVALFPFASAGAKGQRKRWPLASWLRLAEVLADQGRGVAFCWGSPREGEEAREALGPGPREGILLSPRTDLVELTELLRRVDLLITGDTGPMHLAAGVGTRVLALFGPSDPIINRPWGSGHRVLHREPLAGLSVEEVRDAVGDMLD